jgi:restriction system protein
MRAWLVRAGRYGEREALALEQGLAVIGWDEVPDLSAVRTRDELMDELRSAYPDEGERTLLNWQSQLWAFMHSVSAGDLVVLPLKSNPAIAIGPVISDYEYRPDLPADAHHTRRVNWQITDLPRTAVYQDLLFSLGASMTVCEIKRHDAATRLAKLAVSGQDPGWSSDGELSTAGTPSDDEAVPKLLAVYDRLPGDVRAKLPLKQIWVLAADDDGQ